MIQRKERRASSSSGSLDAVLVVSLLLLFAPCLVALWNVPWTAKLAAGILPATVAVGAVAGVLLVLVHLPRRWWWIPFGSALLLGGAIALGASIVARGTHGAYGEPVEPGTVLFGGYIAGMVALLPWLVFRAAQPWLAVVLVWITIVGAWGRQLGIQQVWWLVWLLATSVMLLGLAHLRAEKRRWDAGGLERVGPVLWPSARSILTLSLLVAVLGLLPLGLTRFSALTNLWSRSGLAGGGPLVHESESGTPVAELGAPLSLSAPDVGGDQIILTYQIIAGPASAAPLFGAALDTFDGTTWSGSSTTRATIPAGTLQAPSGSRLLQARITVASLPSSQRGTPLLGFDQPLTFSVPAQAVLLTAGAPSMLNVAGWSTGVPLTRGSTYTVESALLPTNPTASGVLAPDLLTRMTSVPSTLQPLLETTARAWVGTASTPISEANALIDAMQAHLHVDAQAVPAPGTEAVTQLLQDKRGNVLVWTTTYILLCRALGLPVRLAEGYLPGSIESDGRTIVVHASDAAIWAQLAIPGVGWMDFFPAGTNVSVTIPSKVIYKLQPTPTPQRNSSPTPTISPRHAQPSHSNLGAPSSFFNGGAGALLIIVLVFAVLFLVLAICAVLLRVRWARYGHQLAPLPRFFARVAALARLAGIALRSSDTSTQATNKVVAYLPDQATALHTLNDTYEHMRYGPPGERWALPNLRAPWQHLGASLWRLVVTRPWRRNQSSKVEEKG